MWITSVHSGEQCTKCMRDQESRDGPVMDKLQSNSKHNRKTEHRSTESPGVLIGMRDDNGNMREKTTYTFRTTTKHNVKEKHTNMKRTKVHEEDDNDPDATEEVSKNGQEGRRRPMVLLLMMSFAGNPHEHPTRRYSTPQTVHHGTIEDETVKSDNHDERTIRRVRPAIKHKLTNTSTTQKIVMP